MKQLGVVRPVGAQHRGRSGIGFCTATVRVMKMQPAAEIEEGIGLTENMLVESLSFRAGEDQCRAPSVPGKAI
jgi:hypothetical protein